VLSLTSLKAGVSRANRMKRGFNIARNAVKKYLEEEGGKPIPLFVVAGIADIAARKAGARKSDLFSHLDGYEKVLPPDWTTCWLNQTGNRFDDGTLYAVKRNMDMGGTGLKPCQPVPGPYDIGVDSIS